MPHDLAWPIRFILTEKAKVKDERPNGSGCLIGPSTTARLCPESLSTVLCAHYCISTFDSCFFLSLISSPALWNPVKWRNTTNSQSLPLALGPTISMLGPRPGVLLCRVAALISSLLILSAPAILPGPRASHIPGENRSLTLKPQPLFLAQLQISPLGVGRNGAGTRPCWLPSLILASSATGKKKKKLSLTLWQNPTLPSLLPHWKKRSSLYFQRKQILKPTVDLARMTLLPK